MLGKNIALRVTECKNDKQGLWGRFKQHHYLSANLNSAARCFRLLWDTEEGDSILVGFMAVLPNPSGWVKHSYRVSRIVILPDYQNLGIGTKFLKAIGEYYLSCGKKLYIRTTHFRMRKYMESHKEWKASAHNNGASGKQGGTMKTNERMLTRIAGAFEYLGDDYVNKKHLTICVNHSDNFDLDMFEDDMKRIKQKYYVDVVTGNINDKNPIEESCMKVGIRTDLLEIKDMKGGHKISPKHKDKIISTVYNKESKPKVYFE